MRIAFHESPEPTLGVEWELALVDRRSRDLRNDATHLFARARPRLADPSRLHQELLRNTVEVVSGVCRTVGEAMADLRGTLEVVVPAGDALGLDLYGASQIGLPVLRFAFSDFGGFNQTVNGVDGMDLYRLKVDGDRYQFDATIGKCIDHGARLLGGIVDQDGDVDRLTSRDVLRVLQRRQA